MRDSLYVNEIFYSIDGEGDRAGYPSIFIRLGGCNLRCNYCDTAYALTNGECVTMTVNDIIKNVEQYGCKNVTLTGGEPLLQPHSIELLKALKSNGYRTVVETNGSIDVTDALPYCSVCMDWKIPSSGEHDRMKNSNLSLLRPTDVLKIVIRSIDIPYVKKFIEANELDCPIYISPVFEEIGLPEIVDVVKEYHGNNRVRMQIQLHKVIWEPDKRGV